MDVTQFASIAKYLTHPLVLIGFALFLLFGLFQLVIRSGLIPQLTQTQGAKILGRVIHYGFLASVIVAVLGFGLQFYNRKTAIMKNEINKAASALDSVLSEMGSDIISLDALIDSISSAEFGGNTRTLQRRVNESELGYRERIKNRYRDYQVYIDQFYDTFGIRMDTFHAHRNTLTALDGNSLQHIDGFYTELERAYDSLLSYKSDAAHCISLDSSDEETASCLESNLAIQTSAAKAYLCQGYGYLCLLADTYPRVLNSHIPMIFGGISLVAGDEGAAMFRMKSAVYMNKKATALGNISTELAGAKARDVERRVSDPYILYIRGLSGLGEELSQGEILALEKKELSPEKDDPARLMHLATASFMEGDGQYTRIYLERMKACEDIGPKTVRYLEASIKRLENPDMFGESLGIMVMEVEDGGLFHEAGIIEGDILYELNGEALHEPEEISRALGWTSDYSFLLTIDRDGRTITKPITPGKSAGVLTAVLVIFYQTRL